MIVTRVDNDVYLQATSQLRMEYYMMKHIGMRQQNYLLVIVKVKESELEGEGVKRR